ncbi:uncharacterized protein LOC135399329 isoform X2 [Ornithodoros turicata]|uniref:uncharacterized protein LOC135399329 isoform X2 n=1 Tax=Ornithodoros turicata TaxID=34597 RepID=UPI003138D1F3
MMEKEEEAKLDKKYMEQCYEPWGKAYAHLRDQGRKPRFIGELVHPVETSSSIIPTKARSESSLVPRLCLEMALPPQLRRHFFPADFDPRIPGGRRARPTNLTVESYREDLRKQIEEKKKRLEEQRQREKSEEDKLLRRIEEQRQKMYSEYQEEQRRRHKKDTEVRPKQERLTKTQREKSREMPHRAKTRAETKEKRKPTRHRLKTSSDENSWTEKSAEADQQQTEVKRYHPPEMTQRKRSESRDRLVNNVEILRRQLATEQQISRVQQLQKNYTVTDMKRRADPDDWYFPH